MKKVSLLFIVFLLLSLQNAYSKGYNLDVTITNAHDSMLLMARYVGGSTYACDSAYMNKKGVAVFSNEKELEAGVYIIAMEGTQLFDFIISDEKNQQFSIITKKGDFVNSLHFKNSPENEEFANFNRYMIIQQKREEALKEKVVRNSSNINLLNEAEEEERLIKKEYHKYVEEIGKKFPQSLLYSLAKAMDRPIIPKFDIDRNNPKYDSIYAMQYYKFVKTHFFDNYTFSDKRLVNTPMFVPSLNYYFDKIIIQFSDSIIHSVDNILTKTEASVSMQKYIAAHLFNKYIHSNVMGMESIVVHLIDNYYLNDKIGGIDSIFRADISRFAQQNRVTLIGKQAYDLKMETLGGQYESVYSIDAPYMVVYIYEPSCGHCRTETPKLYNIYKKYQDKGLQVYAIYSQQNKKEWMEYVAKNGLDWINVWDPNNENNFRYKYSVYSTPQVFLLDSNKKIIGRRLDSEGLDKLIENLFKNK